MEDSVTTLRPCLTGQVECLDKAEFEIVRNSIVKILLAYGALIPDQLSSLVKNHLRHKFHDSLQRYYEAVFLVERIKSFGGKRLWA